MLCFGIPMLVVFSEFCGMQSYSFNLRNVF